MALAVHTRALGLSRREVLDVASNHDVDVVDIATTHGEQVLIGLEDLDPRVVGEFPHLQSAVARVEGQIEVHAPVVIQTIAVPLGKYGLSCDRG